MGLQDCAREQPREAWGAPKGSHEGAQGIFCKFGGPKREPKATQMGTQNGLILGPIFLSVFDFDLERLGGALMDQNWTVSMTQEAMLSANVHKPK